MTPVAILLFLGVTLAATLAPGPSVLLVTSLGGQDVPLRLAGCGVLASLIDFAVLAGYACAADRAHAALARLRTQRLIDAVSGGVFLIAGVTLGAKHRGRTQGVADSTSRCGQIRPPPVAASSSIHR